MKLLKGKRLQPDVPAVVLFCGQASISLGGWIKVSVMYLLSGRPYRGDDMQPAWTEVRASARMLA